MIGVKEIDSGEEIIFKRPDLNPKPFLEYAKRVSGWIFHNGLDYDVPVLHDFFGVDIIDPATVIDTLVVSRLLNYNRPGGHSLAALGEMLGCPKIEFNDFSELTEDMVKYLHGDLRTGLKVYQHYEKYIFSERWREALRTEHDAAWYCHIMHENGFYFDKETCSRLLDNIQKELYRLDTEIQKAFPPRSKLVREVTPKLTKHGTLSKTDFRWYDGTDYTPFTAGAPFSVIKFEEFNAGSPSQIVERLNEAGWKPFEKTKSHIQAERDRDHEKLKHFRKTGWKVSEANLATLPPSAPEAAKSLARRILLASREGDLKEWLGAYRSDTGRVHGTCNPIGAWTGRAAHRNPNTANIATGDSLYAHEFRGLWQAAPNRLLIGVDADGIQLRIFAHYCRDERLVEAILRGDKKSKTDIHSLNQYALGDVCKTRDHAKTYILSVGCFHGNVIDKLGELLETLVRDNQQPSKGN